MKAAEVYILMRSPKNGDKPDAVVAEIAKMWWNWTSINNVEQKDPTLTLSRYAKRIYEGS